MLVDTKLASHIFLVKDGCAPQTSHDVQRVDEGLSATKSGIQLNVEKVVGGGVVLAISRSAISQRHVDIRSVDATEEGTIVGQIAPAYR